MLCLVTDGAEFSETFGQNEMQISTSFNSNCDGN